MTPCRKTIEIKDITMGYMLTLTGVSTQYIIKIIT